MHILHALIWLSLTTYVWEDYDSICGTFYNGLYYLEEALSDDSAFSYFERNDKIIEDALKIVRQRYGLGIGLWPPVWVRMYPSAISLLELCFRLVWMLGSCILTQQSIAICGW